MHDLFKIKRPLQKTMFLVKFFVCQITNKISRFKYLMQKKVYIQTLFGLLVLYILNNKGRTFKKLVLD